MFSFPNTTIIIIILIIILSKKSRKVEKERNKRNILIAPIKAPSNTFFKLKILLRTTPVVSSNKKS